MQLRILHSLQSAPLSTVPSYSRIQYPQSPTASVDAGSTNLDSTESIFTTEEYLHGSGPIRANSSVVQGPIAQRCA